MVTFHTTAVVAFVALGSFAAEHKECPMETSVLTRNWCINLTRWKDTEVLVIIQSLILNEYDLKLNSHARVRALSSSTEKSSKWQFSQPEPSRTVVIKVEDPQVSLEGHWPAAGRPKAAGISHTPAPAAQAGLSGWATQASPQLYWGTVGTEAATGPPPPGSPGPPPPKPSHYDRTS